MAIGGGPAAAFFERLAELAVGDPQGPWPSGPTEPLRGKGISTPTSAWWRTVAEGYDRRLSVRVFVNKNHELFGVFFSVSGRDKQFLRNVKLLLDHAGSEIDARMGVGRVWIIGGRAKENIWMEFNHRLGRNPHEWADNADAAYQLIRRTYALWDELLRDMVDAIAAGDTADRVIARLPAHSTLLRPDPMAGVEAEFQFAERSEISAHTVRSIDRDLGEAAPEGMAAEYWTRIRRRAAWVAEKFIRWRIKIGQLICDHCGFDPTQHAALSPVRPRSLFDVHHKHPLAEGSRYTTATDSDFALLCPTCHRIEHLLLKQGLRRYPELAPTAATSSARPSTTSAPPGAQLEP